MRFGRRTASPTVHDSDDSEYGEAPEWDEKEVKAMQKEYQKFLKGQSKATEIRGSVVEPG